MKTLTKGILILLVLGIASLAFAADVHVVITEKPIFVKDGDTGQKYSNVKGYCTINWKDGINYGFCYAYATIEKKKLVYEFLLVSIASTNDNEIKGRFDIKRNGVLVAHNVKGRAYGFTGPVGSGYFKIYCGDTAHYGEKWHFSGYITHKFDY